MAVADTRASPRKAAAAPDRPLSRRAFLAGISAGSAVAGLAACVGIPGPAPVASAVTPAAGLTAVAPVLRFHVQSGIYGDMAQAQAADFSAVFPDVDLQVEVKAAVGYVPQLEARLAEGTAADCFWVPFAAGAFHRQANAGHLAPLAPWLEQDGTRNVPYVQAALDAATFQGQPFALPWACHPGRVGCYVNLTLCAAAGVEPPPADGSWTLADLRAKAQALTQRTGNEVAVYGANVGAAFAHALILIRTLGGEIYNAYGNRALLHRAPAVQALRFAYGLIHEDGAMPPPDRLDAYLFEKGNVALSQNGYWGSWIAQTQIGNAFEVGVVPMPQSATGHRGSMLEIEPLCMHRQSAEQARAWRWLTFLAKADAGVQLAQQGGAPGAREDVWADAALQSRLGHAVFARAMQAVAPFRGPGNLRGKECSDLFDEGMAASWLGGEDPASVIPVLETRLNALLAQPPA